VSSHRLCRRAVDGASLPHNARPLDR
jgi:hypothetical protein